MKDRLTILQGDCREVLKTLPDASIDSCVTDPPYELGFMGKAWDKTGVAYDVKTWREVFRLLKPGGHLLSFGGTRTYHRMACAIEDAGFEIRDQMAWVYGSGFPKSLDVSKAIDKAAGAEREKIRHAPRAATSGTMSGSCDSRPWIEKSREVGYHEVAGNLPVTAAAAAWNGWGTALKPAWEPICVARKPIVGTVADNVQEHGTGAMNIDGCRVEIDPDADASQLRSMNRSKRELGDGWGMSTVNGDVPQVVRQDGRWPANLIHDGSEEVLACFPDVASGQPTGIKAGGKLNCYSTFAGGIPVTGFGDSGSAARFFYCAKVSPSERGDSTHPTMKPVDLMRYLVRLVTQPRGTVLDLFGGSGSTAIAAIEEGFRIVVCEIDPVSAELIRKRSDVTPGLGI